MRTPLVVCRGLSVDYGVFRALDKVDLEVNDGETLALLGPSGSGKTTLLYAIAGFVSLAEGEIEISGEVVANRDLSAPPEARSVAFVFQNYALWPHLSAVDTVAYPMRRAGIGKVAARRRAGGLLASLGIGELSDRRPAEMSGGQQQRVGLARALARQASVYLFDEPTAHLDAAARQSVAEEIAERRVGSASAAIHSTHDATEALAVADRVAILRRGRVVQVGTPVEVYERPVDRWAARLTGPASILTGHAADGMLELAAAAVKCEGLDEKHGDVEVMVRADWVELGGSVGGVVTDVWFRGPHTDYRVDTVAGSLVARIPGAPTMSAGERGGWSIRRAYYMGEEPSGAASTTQ